MVTAVPDGSFTSRSHAARTRRWAVGHAGLCLSLLLLLSVVALRWVLSLHTFAWDVWAAQVGMSHKPWPLWDITRAYQQVGRPLVAVAEVAAMSVWLWRVSGRRAAQGLLIALMASAVNGLIKIICGPTPLWLVLPAHVGTNFPSGVVTFMTASGGYLAAIAWREGRTATAAALILAIAGAGPARVLGGQHLISDVCGAYMLGTAWLLVAYRYALATGEATVWERVLRTRRRGESAAGLVAKQLRDPDGLVIGRLGRGLFGVRSADPHHPASR